MSTLTDIADLLHDASLVAVQWCPGDASLTLTFHCLRRGPNGEDLSQVPVEISMLGVTAVVLGHWPALFGTRPSEYHPERCVSLDDLESWSFAPQEPEVFVNSAQAQEDVLGSHRVDAVVGASKS